MDVREQLRRRFNRNFAHWEIELPIDALSPGLVWLIVQRGWTIWTRFYVGAEDGREYLDYYATHRMTNDRHVRLYAGGCNVRRLRSQYTAIALPLLLMRSKGPTYVTVRKVRIERTYDGTQHLGHRGGTVKLGFPRSSAVS